jgi:hypothetical protein
MTGLKGKRIYDAYINSFTAAKNRHYWEAIFFWQKNE